MSVLDVRSLLDSSFQISLIYLMLSYIFALVVLKFESWYLPTESGAVRVRPLSWPGCPYQDSAQVVICIQSMQIFSLTLSPRLLHDRSHFEVEQNDSSSTLFLSKSVRFHRPPHAKVIIYLETFLKHGRLIHKVAARSLVLSCENICAA